MGITAGEAMPEDMDPRAKQKWLSETYGEGVRDALKDEPKREFGMIHRLPIASHASRYAILLGRH